MKLKPIVVTMCILGLSAAGTAFAESSTDAQIANLQAQIQQLQAQVDHMSMSSGSSSSKGGMMSGMTGLITLNQPISQIINSDANATGQTLALLQASTQGKIAHGLTLGGMMQGDLFWVRSNTGSVFANPYLDASNSTARNRTAVTLTNVKLSAVASINRWTNGVLQLGDYYAGQSINDRVNSTFSFSNGSISVQQAYLLVGDLSKSPFYGFVGKKYIDFGQFQNVNPFTQPLTREFFQANGNTLGVGIVAANFDVALSVMNGGQHNGVIYSTNGVVAQNLYTRNKSMVNNFALNVGYGMKSDNNVDWHVGVGLLNGGGNDIAKADSNVTSMTDLKTNQVVDVNARMSLNNMDFYAEYLTSLNNAATYNESTTTWKDGGRAQGWQVAGDYKFPLMGRNSVFGLSYSAVKSVEFGNGSYNQLAASLRQEALKNVWVGVEYAYQDGVPYTTVDSNHVVNNHANTTNNTVTLDLTAYF